ncbi:MAG: DUF2804 family protein [Sphingobacteriales bacterium]|jgi:hypothetical protein|nr:MAG: DUF2804 family protein [Sphingobacteriales bacterium]
MKISAAQKQLIQNGKPLPFGVYDGLIEDVSTAAIDKSDLLYFKRRTERKTWIFFGYYSKEIICGIAIADAGATSLAFSYIFIPDENIFIEDKITIPFGFSNDFDPNLNSTWKLKNYSITTNGDTIEYKTVNSKFELTATCTNNNKNGFSVVATSDAKRPFNFTYKNLCIPTSVTIKYNNKVYKGEGNFGSIDFTKGYPPRETTWNWLSFIGTTESGKEIASNIVDQFNDNLENVLFINGEKHLLSNAKFDYKKPLDKNNWNIKTADNILDLTLFPNGKRTENLNFVVMKSLFTQVFGKIEGTVQINNQTEKFTAYGVTEEHFALW